MTYPFTNVFSVYGCFQIKGKVFIEEILDDILSSPWILKKEERKGLFSTYHG